MTRTSFTRRVLLACLTALIAPLVGCSSFALQGINAVPAHRLPKEFTDQVRKDEMQDISLQRLRLDPPDVYQLAPGDILGVFIENVIGNTEELPPVHYPDDPTKAPVVGFPVPVREDGTIMLPIVEPISVEGLSVAQAAERIRQEFTIKNQILRPENDRILCELIQRRTYRVLVVREEQGGLEGVSKRGSGHVLDMPAYENDIMHALNMTGGFPGIDVKNEVVIYRGMFNDGVERDKLIAQVKNSREPCMCPPHLPEFKDVVRIPLRFSPGQFPEFSQEDITLLDNDILMIESRDNEIFYTGGVLGGREVQLPRDRDTDIIAALALTGGAQFGGAGQTGLNQALGGRRGGVGGGGRGGRNGQVFPATRVVVLRQLCDGSQIAIRIDLNRALTDPSQRILIQPKDVVILEYTIAEELGNAIFSIVNINFLFNGFSGNSF